jgi:hypothetical protein
MKKLLLLLLVMAVFLVGACSDDDDPAPVVLASGGSLEGNWAVACGPDEDNPADGATLALTFAGPAGAFTFNLWFGDNTCGATSGATSDITFAGGFNFAAGDATLGDTVTLAGGETVTRVTITDTSETITPNNDATTAMMNQGFYGITDWQTGVPKSVFGLDESGAADPAVPEKDIAYIDETATPNTLQLGDDGFIGADGYPTALLADEIFIKQ